MKTRKDSDGLFENIRLIGGDLHVATDKHVSTVENQLGFALPSGYREFVTRFGEGKYADTVKVLMPSEVLSDIAGYRETVEEFWFWDEEPIVLTKEEAVGSIRIASSDYGDILIYNPRKPRQLFVLPRDDERIFEAGANLAEALEWMRTSPILGLKSKEKEFKSSITIEAEQEAQLQAALQLASNTKQKGKRIQLYSKSGTSLEVSGSPKKVDKRK